LIVLSVQTDSEFTSIYCSDNSMLPCWNCGFSCCVCRGKNYEGKVAIITGANQGVGYYVAKNLICKGYIVILACRSKERGEEAERKLKKYGDARFIICDLSSLDSVSEFCNSFRELNLPLHLLVNNAGVMGVPFGKTKDGFEMHFGVNHLGHFLMTMLLIDILKQNAPSRIVNVASNAHMLTGSLQFQLLPNYNDGKNYGGSAMNAYSQSKQCNILFTYELARRLKGSGVSAIVVHPGVIRTSLWQHINPTTLCICKCPTDGALPVINASCSSQFTSRPIPKEMKRKQSAKELKEIEYTNRSKEKMYIPCCCCTLPSTTMPETYSKETQLRLWELSMRYIRFGIEDQNGKEEEVNPIIREVNDLPQIDNSPSVIPFILRLALPSFGLCPLCWCCA